VTARARAQAGAHVEDLRTRCAFFYEVALRLAALAPMEGLGKLVTAAFRARYKVGGSPLHACLCVPLRTEPAAVQSTAQQLPRQVAYDVSSRILNA